MKITFDVHGPNERALVEEADKVLAAFSEAKRWNIQIEAYPEGETVGGTIQSWKGEVTAEHEAPE